MATSTPTTFFRGAASTTSTTLYTTPGATTSIVTELFLANSTSLQQNLTISLNGTPILPNIIIAAGAVLDFQIKQPLSSGQTISGFATSTGVIFHIAGVQVA
jgi:hypothetical protein